MQNKKYSNSPGWFNKLQQILASEKTVKLLLLCLILLFIGYFTYDSFLRHDNFFSLRLDLGNMDQTVWNVLHGNGFTLTDPMGTAQESRLAVHADFLLILLAPFYLIWSNPKMLLIIQAVALACGAVPIYWLAKKVIRKKWIALLFSAAYLLYPTIQMNTLHDFHATSLTTTFLLFAYWYFVVENPIAFTVFIVLAALGKEQFWAISAMLGVCWFFKPKFKAFGASVFAVSSLIFYLLFWKFIPAVTPSKQYWALAYLSEYGANMNEILRNIFKHPWQAFISAFAPDRLHYYYQLLAPTAFLSLLSPWTLLFALPNLGINVLSNNQMMRMIDYQYTSGISPWVFVSSIYGFAVAESMLRTKTFVKKNSWIILSVIVGACILGSAYYWGELPYGVHSRFWFFHTVQPEKTVMKQVAKSIPSRYSVSATNNIGAHFSERKILYNYPINATIADYVVVLLGDQYAWPSGDEQKRVLQSLLKDKDYQLIAQSGLFFAFKRQTL